MNHYHKHPFISSSPSKKPIIVEGLGVGGRGRMVFRGSGGDQSSPEKYKGELYRNLTANWIVNQDPPLQGDTS